MSFELFKLKFEKNVSVQKPQITFSSSNVFRQSFPYPRTLINYFKMHPSTTELHVNLLKSCKYFYSKTDLFIPLNHYDRWVIEDIISTKKEAAKYKIPFKIWFTDYLSLAIENKPSNREEVRILFHEAYLKWKSKQNSTLESNNHHLKLCLVEKLHKLEPLSLAQREAKIWRKYYLSKNSARCRFEEVHLVGEKITFEEFKILTENGLETFDCRRTTIMYENGTVVPIEAIFANLKKIKGVHYAFGKENAKLVTKETAKNLTKIIDTSKLIALRFNSIPSTFDFETFKKFTDAHPYIHFDIGVIISDSETLKYFRI